MTISSSVLFFRAEGNVAETGREATEGPVVVVEVVSGVGTAGLVSGIEKVTFFSSSGFLSSAVLSSGFSVGLAPKEKVGAAVAGKVGLSSALASAGLASAGLAPNVKPLVLVGADVLTGAIVVLAGAVAGAPVMVEGKLIAGLGATKPEVDGEAVDGVVLAGVGAPKLNPLVLAVVAVVGAVVGTVGFGAPKLNPLRGAAAASVGLGAPKDKLGAVVVGAAVAGVVPKDGTAAGFPPNILALGAAVAGAGAEPNEGVAVGDPNVGAGAVPKPDEVLGAPKPDGVAPKPVVVLGVAPNVGAAGLPNEGAALGWVPNVPAAGWLPNVLDGAGAEPKAVPAVDPKALPAVADPNGLLAAGGVDPKGLDGAAELTAGVPKAFPDGVEEPNPKGFVDWP